MMKIRLRRLTVLFLTIMLCAAGQAVPQVFARTAAALSEAASPDKPEALPLPSSEAAVSDTITLRDEYEGKQSVLELSEDTGTITWKFHVSQAGRYLLGLSYYALNGKAREIEFNVLVDGQPLKGRVSRAVLTKQWRYDGDIQSDGRGNDMLPGKEFVAGWQQGICGDRDGEFRFELQSGEHSLTLDFESGQAIFADTALVSPESLPDYEQYIKTHSNKTEVSNFVLPIEGENPSLMSDPAIGPLSDRSSAATVPNDPARLKLNTIGASSWQQNGQWVEWSVQIPETGLYTIGIKARQNLLRGQTVYRRLYIDGQTPFEEVKMIPFGYGAGWNNHMLGQAGKPFRFYLEKGERKIRLQVIYGVYADSVLKIDETLKELNAVYRSIYMITGSDPDPNTDYFIQREVPNLLETLKRCRESLNREKSDLENLAGQKIQGLAVLETLSVQLAGFTEKPDTIPMRLQSYKDNISGLSAFVINFKNQPLEIDYINVLSADRSMESSRAGFWAALGFRARAFFASFLGDYNSIGDVSDTETPLDVWVTLGRDYAQVIKRLTDNTFTREFGAPVRISLVQQGAAAGVIQQPLLQATMAGQGPDIALFVNTSDPVNLAARGVLSDLSRYPEYDEVKSRFSKNAMVPYTYEQGTYALPLTEAFYMMFYRTDIFEELHIKPPDTWDELFNIMPVIQRKNMEIGFPSIAVNPGAASVANNSLFQLLLFQKGGAYYSDDRTRVELDSPQALEAFKQWTAYYSQYSFPLEYDFYSRFRTGEMPLAIDSYSMFNKLNVATPELKGLWDFAPLPATVRPGGAKDRTTVGGGQAAVMFTKTPNKDLGWKFLKWFTDASTQAELGYTIENVVGAGARFETANIEAFKQLPWQAEQQKAILDQWDQMQLIPQTPASYYEFRSVYNAFRKVVFSNGNPREVLLKYNSDINKEIRRKREEFGLYIPPENTQS